jgi:hypothetical protein
MSSPADAIPDALVLAAIERAARHRASDTPEVPAWAIKEHLNIPRRSRRIRTQLDALEAGGSLVRSRRHGIPTWVLTNAGHRRLQRARRAGNVPALPESPQHQAWRNARTLAEQEIERFRRELRDCLTDTIRLLDADTPASSDVFFEVAERLRAECRRLGSATYCLRDWAEPDDERVDIDDRHEPGDDELSEDERAQRRWRRNGRRNVSLWVSL